jgi:AcrR family transcriptional regulator
MDAEPEAIERIYRALVAGEFGEADLSARRIASFLGKTTGAIYHHWGSFDGLLFALSQRGFADLGAAVASAWERAHDLADCAEAFVAFGLDHPELYPLMFERRFDWNALRAAGFFERQTPGGELLAGVVRLLGEGGSESPLADTRLLMAGLHGIVSFAASGRMNAGELATRDRDVAMKSARHLAARVCPFRSTKTSPTKKRART